MTAPQKVFISYSWASQEHEEWVVDLAKELVQNGVDVIFDKWELREGNDTIPFMEKMVTDKSISKVIMVFDRTYASKADSRTSGVGTETQIISGEIYAKKDQTKFAAVIAEKDESGKPFLPAYYKSRLFIDLSEPDGYVENFEKLLRWIYDKPLYVKPEIGSPPSFLFESTSPLFGTSSLAKRILEGFKNSKPYTKGTLDEYLTLFSNSIEKFRIEKKDDIEFDELMIKSIEDFTPYRIELIKVIKTMIQYGGALDNIPRIHRFFESMLPYHFPSRTTSQYSECDFDNFRFITQELFLSTLAILLQNGEIESAKYLLVKPYYIERVFETGSSASVSYTEISQETKSLDIRNRRLNLKRTSLRADILESHAKSSDIPFSQIMQADLICFLRADWNPPSEWARWWPETLVYASHQHGAFELFSRSSSIEFLSPILRLLGVKDLKQVQEICKSYSANTQSLPRFGYSPLNVARLIGLEKMGTQP